MNRRAFIRSSIGGVAAACGIGTLAAVTKPALGWGDSRNWQGRMRNPPQLTHIAVIQSPLGYPREWILRPVATGGGGAVWSRKVASGLARWQFHPDTPENLRDLIDISFRHGCKEFSYIGRSATSGRRTGCVITEVE